MSPRVLATEWGRDVYSVHKLASLHPSPFPNLFGSTLQMPTQKFKLIYFKRAGVYVVSYGNN